MNTSLFPIITVGALVGLVAGYLGSLMVLRRMSLVGDALSHVALPGLALGLLLHFNPFWGALATLVVAVILIWLIENKSKLPIETLVGIFFTLSLAIGLMLTPEPELLEALFGNISQISLVDIVLTVALSMVAIEVGRRIYQKLILGTISDDLAKSVGINTKKIDFLFLMLVALIVALGIKVVGTLLMGSLVIIPAATAKNLSQNLKSYSGLSAFFGLVSAVGGIFGSVFLGISPGPMVVLFGSALFFISLLIKHCQIK